MNDQRDIDFINKKLYKVTPQRESVKSIMFYFTILHNIIDYPFPMNYLNFNAPFFKTNKDLKQFIFLAKALNPEFLQINNTLIFYNNKKFYQSRYNIHLYEFKVINPSEANSSKFQKNYENSFNIHNIDSNQIQFEVVVPQNTQDPYFESSESENGEEFYYDENNNNNNSDNPYKTSNKDVVTDYDDIRKKYNQQIIESHKKTNYLYENQLAIDCEDEDENNKELDDIQAINEKVNIINMLVCSNEWLDNVYYKPMKKLMKSVFNNNNDEIRVKSVSFHKNVFFYLLIFLTLIVIACSAVLIYSCATLKNSEKFNELNNNNDSLIQEPIDYNNDTVIVPCKSCYKSIKLGCQMGIVSGEFSIFFIIFVIAMYIGMRIYQSDKCNKNGKRKRKGFNIWHILTLAFLHLTAFVLCAIAEIFIILGLLHHTYFFIHKESRSQLIVNSILLTSIFLYLIFYFKK